MKHLAALAILILTSTACQKQIAKRSTSADATPEAHTQEISKDERPYYRYSVVSGGVYSQKEALDRIAHDAVVKQHYAPIHADLLTPRINDRDRDVYVSYRVGQNVYWTSKPVKLKKNEMVLTDGVNEIRTRCGNRIADAPQGPVNAVVEPQPDVFDTKVQQADAGFSAEVNAGAATPMGGVIVPQVPQTGASLPPPNPQPAPGPVTVASGGGGGVVRAGGGGGGAGGIGGGGGGAGVVPVSPDGATWPGYFGNPNGNMGLLVLQMPGAAGAFMTNYAGPVYNYSTSLIVPAGTPSVGSVIYSPTFGAPSTAFSPLPVSYNSGMQLAFGGLAPLPVYFHSSSANNVANFTNVSGGVNGSGGSAGNGGSGGSGGIWSPATPGAPGAPGTPGTPGSPLDPGVGPNTAVPEPGTLGMGMIAALVAAWLRQRQKKSA